MKTFKARVIDVETIKGLLEFLPRVIEIGLMKRVDSQVPVFGFGFPYDFEPRHIS